MFDVEAGAAAVATFAVATGLGSIALLLLQADDIISEQSAVIASFCKLLLPGLRIVVVAVPVIVVVLVLCESVTGGRAGGWAVGRGGRCGRGGGVRVLLVLFEVRNNDACCCDSIVAPVFIVIVALLVALAGKTLLLIIVAAAVEIIVSDVVFAPASSTAGGYLLSVNK